MPSEPHLPPRRIETPRTVLRLCTPEEAPLMREAIDGSLEHLRAWLPWAVGEPATLPATRERLEKKAAEFARGDDFQYGIFDRNETRILGGIGLHRRAGPRCLEIGYWIRADYINQGLGTEAARAVAIEALRLPDVDRVQIHCDPDNERSRRIPEKLGFELVERRRGDKQTPDGRVRDTLVYEHRRLRDLEPR